MRKNLFVLSLVTMLMSMQNVSAQTTAEDGNITANYPMSSTISHVWNFADPALVNALVGNYSITTMSLGTKTIDGLYLGSNATYKYLGFSSRYGEIETGSTTTHAKSLQDGSEENKDDNTGVFSYMIPANTAGRLSCRMYMKTVGTTTVRCRVGASLKDPFCPASNNWNFGTIAIDKNDANTAVYFGKSNSGGSDLMKCYSLAWVPSGAENLSVVIDKSGIAAYTPNVNVTIPDGLKAYYLSSASGKSATIKEITDGVIPALCAVILQSKATITNSQTFNFTIAADGITGINGGNNKNYLMGAAENTKLKSSATSGDGSQTFYYLSVADDLSVGLKKVSTDEEKEMARYSAFLPIENTSDPSDYSDFLSIGLTATATTTGVKKVSTDNIADTAPYYNLQGMKVTNPTKGVYVHAGKKVILK
jgi:hypothetical protein